MAYCVSLTEKNVDNNVYSFKDINITILFRKKNKIC